MARAASSPFITGIIISIRMTSKAPGAAARKVSRASRPFQASVMTAPSCSRRKRAISMFISLSSTRRMRTPRRAFFSGTSAGPSAAGAPATRKGRMTVKQVPSPSLLVKVMVPPMRSTSSRVMASPRPVPA